MIVPVLVTERLILRRRSPVTPMRCTPSTATLTQCAGGHTRLLERLGFTLEGQLLAGWETHIGVRDSLIWRLHRDERRVEQA